MTAAEQRLGCSAAFIAVHQQTPVCYDDVPHRDRVCALTTPGAQPYLLGLFAAVPEIHPNGRDLAIMEGAP